MNKTKIEYCHYTWNPITGCLHGCWYCYARRMFLRFHKSFEPQFHPERLKELDKVHERCIIFVCSVSDIFAPWTKEAWRRAVLDKISQPQYSHITFLLLTKSPEGIHNVPVRDNIWVGVSVTFNEEMSRVETLVQNYGGNKYVSFEPLLQAVDIKYDSPFNKINWAIVGKLTGAQKANLEPEWIEDIIEQARSRKIPVFIKDNTGWPPKFYNIRSKARVQEYPEGMAWKR